MAAADPPWLHALHNATNLALELYNSSKKSSRVITPAARSSFTMPTVINGKVYVGAEVCLVGLLAMPSLQTRRLFRPRVVCFTNAVVYHALRTLRREPSIYYTLGWHDFRPTNSPVYTGPLTLTNRRARPSPCRGAGAW